MMIKNKQSSFPTDPSLIRNICILAHVDHGKTTLVDHLIASNNIISDSMAGKFKYMDYKEEEQKHGVTMKSAAIMLDYKNENINYLINVIDSPGHVDFSMEVSCAVRICDGALCLIDVVEGVCPQTELVLRQSWKEGIVPCLAINKIDRIINELQMSSIDAYYHIFKIVEEANAIMSNLYKETEIEYKKYHEKPIYFSPVDGNVIFCSGLNGWGFRIKEFALHFSKKLNINYQEMLSSFWGDYYFNFKHKCKVEGALSLNKKPNFVTFILDNIWRVYEGFCGIKADESKQDKIIKNLNVKVNFDKNQNPKIKYSILMKNWLPLVNSLLKMVIEFIPSPSQLSSRRIELLLSSSLKKFDQLPSPCKRLKSIFLKCSSVKESPTVIFVAKMMLYNCHDVKRSKIILNTSDSKPQFYAFSRIFSGSVSVGDSLYVLTPKYIPKITDTNSSYDNKFFKYVVKEIFLMMGRDLISVESVPAGNIFGMSGLEEYIYKSGTVSSTLDCPSFSSLNFEVNPIMSVAVEPEKLSDYEKLVKSISTLNMSDPILHCSQSSTGEHLLNVVGEVHLLKCIEDLQQIMGDARLTISKPIINLRETVIQQDISLHIPIPQFLKSICENSDFEISNSKFLSIKTHDGLMALDISVEHLSYDLVEFIEKNNSLFNKIGGEISTEQLKNLKNLLDNQTHICSKTPVSDYLMCFSQEINTNILIFDCDFQINSWFKKVNSKIKNSMIEDSISRAMQIVCSSGPLMGERLTGVCFIVNKIHIDNSILGNDSEFETSCHLIGLAKQGFISSLIFSNKLRCSIPIYRCTLRSSCKFLRNVYNVLNKRYAKILSDCQLEGTSIFTITSEVPAPEILGMYDEIRSQTSGTVQMQLTYDHWESIMTNPLFDESTLDSNDNILRIWIPYKVVQNYVYSTRKTKGLSVDEKIIQDSEKQRTVKRNK